MAQYSQVHQGVYEMGSDGSSTYHSTLNPNDPSSYGYFTTGKPAPFPTNIEFEASQHLMHQNAPTGFVQRPVQHQPLRRRLGKTGMTIIILGTIVILASCALLVYLWQGAEKARNRQPRGKEWDRIIFDNYAAQVATLCSAAIRVSMDLQTCLAAASMAAIVLETAGCRLSDLARLSISRAFGCDASPWDIFLITKGNRKTLFHCIILLFSFLLSLAMTFTSTILLFDFKTLPIAAPMVSKSIYVGFDISKDTAVFSGISYWQSKPSAHWRFAETRPSSQKLAPKDVADTGDVYRAMIPMANVDNRTSLEYYSGTTIVSNMRTACVAPTLNNATLEYIYTGNNATEGLYLQAEFNSSTGWKSGPSINGSYPATLSCRINNEWDQTNSTSWPISFCSFNLKHLAPKSESLKNPLSRHPYNFHPVLLLNASDVLSKLRPVYDEDTNTWLNVTIPDDIQMTKSKSKGPWTTATSEDGTQLFQASVCFLSQNTPLLYNVTMTGRAIPSEPTSIAKWKTLQGKNGTEFLKQLGIGVSPSDTEARGILDLKILSGPASLADTGVAEWDEWVYQMIHFSLFDYSISGGWTFNNDALQGWFDTVANWPAHPEHSHLFQGVLQETDDPARAVQELFFRFYQMIFHDILPYFTQQQSVTTINVKQVLIPNKWTGLTIILSGVILHLALTLTTVTMFMASTKSSILGNAWHAVSQIISPETSVVVETVSSNGMRDGDVAKWAKSTSSDEYLYGLSTCADNKIRRR
ncbi:hypothetical protein FOYG_10683 [Fusarium oxysporum NRRL 32931]|uniref:Uncharacterized protein n=1 Tax=Fusarium oxysporum NRRL 32931 TaxID=660029 RepID=W9HYE7_FUSOX|nr:hypothetical protein FOYG_10683 [Fusarium oxysporum NRRL 32931]